MHKNCLNCRYQPEWQVTGYDGEGWPEKSGYCKCPMPFTDSRRSISFDTEWNTGLEENCPAFTPSAASHAPKDAELVRFDSDKKDALHGKHGGPLVAVLCSYEDGSQKFVPRKWIEDALNN